MRHFISFLCAGILLTLAAASVASADDNQFTIDSYVPQRFIDLEWRINGSSRLSGSDDNLSYDRRFTDQLNSYSREESSDGYDVNFANQITYRYFTVPRSWSISTRLTGSFDSESRDRSILSTEQNSVTRDNRIESEADFDYVDVSFDLTGRGEQYLLGDLFAAIDVTYGFDYDQLQRDDRETRIDFIQNTSLGVDRLSETRMVADYQRDSRSHHVKGSWSVGWGRMYVGQYAATAMYIVDQLRTAGLLLREPTNEEMEALTETIYHYRLEHVVDFRLLEIDALAAIFDNLINQAIMDSTTPPSYLLTQDVWRYFPRFDREFGWRVRAGQLGRYNYHDIQMGRVSTRNVLETEITGGVVDTLFFIDDEESVQYESTTDEFSSGALFVAGEYEHPINLYWQVSGSATVERWFDEEPTTRRFSSEIDRTDRYRLVAEGHVRYIPTSRTDVLASLRFDRDWYDETLWVTFPGPNELTARSDITTWALTSRIQAEYRIAIPTTLRATLLYQKSKNVIDQTDYTNSTSLEFYDEERTRNNYQLHVSVIHWIY